VSDWISVCGWRRFQHYDPAKRQPPWIKIYTELMSDDAWLGLSGHDRAVLICLWLEYASSRCRLPLDARSSRSRGALGTLSLSRRLGLRVTTATLERLIDAGFIEIVASKTLAEGYHDASASRARVETETEEETEVVDVNTLSTSRASGRNGWVDDLNSYTGCRLVRGEIGSAHVYDPLGTERPPFNWPYERPTRAEIRKALEERAHA
jgi:hypothetical protein